MRLVDLAALYLLTGTACAVALYRRDPARGVLNAITALPLWPLWAPIAWTARAEAAATTSGKGDRLRAVRNALDQTVASVAGATRSWCGYSRAKSSDWTRRRRRPRGWSSNQPRAACAPPRVCTWKTCAVCTIWQSATSARSTGFSRWSTRCTRS